MKLPKVIGIWIYAIFSVKYCFVHANGSVQHEKSTHDTKSAYDEHGVLSLNYHSFLEDITKDASLDDGIGSSHTMYLLAVYNDNHECECSSNLLRKLEQTSKLLYTHFERFPAISDYEQYTKMKSISRPVVAKVNVYDAMKQDNLQRLFDITQPPHLKVVMYAHVGRQRQRQNGGETSTDEDDTGEVRKPETYSFDYVGKDMTAQDIFQSVLHYYYRLLVAESTELSTIDEIINDDPSTDREDDIITLIPSRPLFTMPSLDSLKQFLHIHTPYIMSKVVQDFFGTSEREREYLQRLMRNVGAKDPFHIFVQCRDMNEASKHLIPENVQIAYDDYDQTALLYLYRRDVLFFTVIAESCDWIDEDGPDERIEGASKSGAIRELAMTSIHPDIDWVPGSLFYPSNSKTFYDVTEKEYWHLGQKEYALIQTTPSIVWLDRHTTTSMIFPIYRQIHFVLFLDLHTVRNADGSFDYSSTTFTESLRAIEMLHSLSVNHKKTTPSEDVVFIIVPSTEVEILKTFGIDIWSDLDHACNDSESSDCLIDTISSLPAAMITSRRENQYSTRVFHLPSQNITSASKGDNPLQTFFDKYFHDPESLQPSIRKERTFGKNNFNNTLSSGVNIATSTTFNESVTISEKNCIVYFYSPTCGHCKRFDIVWRNFSKLIRKLQWENHIDVIQVDITQNDLFLDFEIASVPAVFFFPKGQNQNFQELLLESDLLMKQGSGQNEKDRDNRVENNLGGFSDPTSILKWLLKMLSREELERLKKLSSE